MNDTMDVEEKERNKSEEEAFELRRERKKSERENERKKKLREKKPRKGDIEEVEEVEEILDLFLWISHGENVGSVNKFFPIETKFNSVILHSKPFKIITGVELEDILKSPCRLILGSCPAIPIIDKNTGKKDVFLPPLVFLNLENDDPYIKVKSGLYYYQIKLVMPSSDFFSEKQMKNPFTKGYLYELLQYEKFSCQYIKEEKILDHKDIINRYPNGNFITYSQIYSLVEKECINRGLTPENVVLSIFSCQIRSLKYVQKYKQQIGNLIPRIDKEELIPAVIYNIHNINREWVVSPTIIKVPNNLPADWTALAGIKYQGCALNTLSYFGLIDENESRERSACLSRKGTSIFKIADYINTYFNTHLKMPIFGYIIVRYNFDWGISKIVYFLMKNPENSAVIFKMYNTRLISNNPNIPHNPNNPNNPNEYSHIGHTVSIFRKDNAIFYIDPQGGIKPTAIIGEIPTNIQEVSVTQTSELASYIKNLYLPNLPEWSFIDIIYTVSQTNDLTSKRPQHSISELEKDDILTKPENISYGGTNNKLKRKTMKKRKTKKIILRKKNKYQSMKKRNKRSKKYYGGVNINDVNLDEVDFEELMQQIDKDHNTPTTLDTVIIKDI